MQNIIFLLLTLLTSLYSQTNNQWLKLLHHYNDQNQISSKEFYITENTFSTPEEELQEMIKVLKSGKGKTLACNFPARYEYIKNIYETPEYNLKECKDLTNFVKSFPQDSINLVFTSEYTNNPSSAFGHTMLLFSDKDKHMEIGDAVHFAAKTSKKDNFFKYSYKGFTGKYEGYFLREPFYQKIYDYNTLEQRYMYIYKLNFSKQQILKLIYHLYELRKATFKYYFLDGNCATQTTDLLNTITNNIRSTNKTYYLPIDTIKDFKDFISKKTRYIPLLNKLNLLLSQMSNKETRLFYSIISSNRDLIDSDPDIVKEAMVYYSTFYFRRYHRIYKNYTNVMKQSYNKSKIIDSTPNPLEKTQPSNIGVGIYNQNNTNYLSFHYRPLFIDMLDIQINSMQQSQVNTMTFDLIANFSNIKLKKFDLANIKSFVNQSQYYTPMSWNLYSGFTRNNYNYDLKFVNEIGIGRTNSFFNKINTTLLVSLGLENTKVYLKPSIELNSYLSSKSKLGLKSSYKQFDTKHFKQSELYFTTKYNNFIYQLNITHDNSKIKNNYLMSIKYNF